MITRRAAPGYSKLDVGCRMLVLTLLCLGFGAGCSRRMPPQSQVLDEHSRITLADAWILDHTPRLLQILFVYDGVDPNRTYDLKASLRVPGHASYWGGGWIKQIPIPSGPATNQTQVIWEFLSLDRKSTRLNSSHLVISYAVFCLKKK